MAFSFTLSFLCTPVFSWAMQEPANLVAEFARFRSPLRRAGITDNSEKDRFFIVARNNGINARLARFEELEDSCRISQPVGEGWIRVFRYSDGMFKVESAEYDLGDHGLINHNKCPGDFNRCAFEWPEEQRRMVTSIPRPVIITPRVTLQCNAETESLARQALATLHIAQTQQLTHEVQKTEQQQLTAQPECEAPPAPARDQITTKYLIRKFKPMLDDEREALLDAARRISFTVSYVQSNLIEYPDIKDPQTRYARTPQEVGVLLNNANFENKEGLTALIRTLNQKDIPAIRKCLADLKGAVTYLFNGGRLGDNLLSKTK